MSESCQKTTAKAIPTTRLITINDEAHLPHDYSTTPGGTLFSTTPGGTRIIYDRKFLLERRSSPVARTPPLGLPNIPGVTSPRDVREKAHIRKPLINNNNNIIIATANGKTGDDAQFEMDI